LSVINALIVAIGMSRKPHVQETFERLEKIWTSTKCMKNKITIPITERKIKKVTVCIWFATAKPTGTRKSMSGTYRHGT